jgi:hypothetical protein
LHRAKLTPLYSDALLSFYFLFTMFGELCNRHRRLAKKRVQCLNEALCFVSSSVLADSLVLRNPLLRQAPKRYGQCYWRPYNLQPTDIKPTVKQNQQHEHFRQF